MITLTLGVCLWVGVGAIDNAIIMVNLIYITYPDKFPGEAQWIIALFNVFLFAKLVHKATTKNE
jgi:hypothetical protein